MLYAIKWSYKRTIGMEVFNDSKKRTAYKKSMGKAPGLSIELVNGTGNTNAVIKRVNGYRSNPNVKVLPVQYHK